jgi:putative spermidine/putrescine transport system ATP-binding protein
MSVTTESQGASIEVVGLSKLFDAGKPAVDNISLRIAKGSYCCLLGPSGCGKSTTLRMIAGHESVSSGDVLLDNRNITDLPAAERGTAMMFQSFALFPHLSALDNVAFSLKMKGVAKPERHARAQALLERVAMGHLAQRKPGELSGGQQQRVALARALITQPKALLLDEPFSALDALTRESLQDHLLALWEQHRPTLVLVTHDVEETFAPLHERCRRFTSTDDLLAGALEATRAGDQVLIMSNGGFDGLHGRLLNGLANREQPQS